MPMLNAIKTAQVTIVLPACDAQIKEIHIRVSLATLSVRNTALFVGGFFPNMDFSRIFSIFYYTVHQEERKREAARGGGRAASRFG